MIENVRAILSKLGSGGWKSLFDKLNIDAASETLKDDLLKPIPLSPIELAMLPGFGDISPAANRAIEPGNPAQSILFHAISSPGVSSQPDGTPFTVFPNAADLDTIENVVFGLVPPTFEALTARFGNTANIAAVVFAREYRQPSKTVHGNHADLVFSRTGITRVGTDEASWDGVTRSYLPRKQDDDPFMFRVLPCRYGIYLAVQLKGEQNDFGPFKFNRAFDLTRQAINDPDLPGALDLLLQEADQPDSELDFWVPVHKLFSGTDCLLGLTLDVELNCQHINEKLRRIHVNNLGAGGLGGFDTGFKPPKTEEEPFLVKDGLASFLNENANGAGSLAATVRPRLIEPTTIDGEQIGTKIPARRHGGLAPSFFTSGGRTGAHPSPEWMHVRSRLKSDGTVDDLNLRQDVAEVVRRARVGNVRNYTAGHYTDFTGDGWVDARVDGLLGSRLDRMVPAYSVIAAPDFYPYVDQSVLLDWWRIQVPTTLRKEMWNRLPLTLADQRSAANITLRDFGGDIRPENKTPTAMVGLKNSAATAASLGSEAELQRVSYLPDAGAGVYQPGWDVSTDFSHEQSLNEDVFHLAAYGLGSPFPEDAKLCAALSAFWPGVAPDTARSSGFRPIAPMTDREVGHYGTPAWDGVPGPRRFTDQNNRNFVETDSFDHVDYVANALAGRFTMVETMKVTQEDYQIRVLATARMRQFLRNLNNAGSDDPLNLDSIRIHSFGQGRGDDALVAEAEAALGIQFDERVCRYELAEVTAANRPIRDDLNPARWITREEITAEVQVVIGANELIAFRFEGGNWRLHQPLVS